MATQAQPSPHLISARLLLEEISGDDPQVKATIAMVHATLVVAEQVAALRLILAAQAVNGNP